MRRCCKDCCRRWLSRDLLAISIMLCSIAVSVERRVLCGRRCLTLPNKNQAWTEEVRHSPLFSGPTGPAEAGPVGNGAATVITRLGSYSVQQLYCRRTRQTVTSWPALFGWLSDVWPNCYDT